MTEQEIKDTLKQGACKFTFNKKDGTVREAYGTRQVETITNEGATPKGTGTEKEGVITYYDLDKNAWRSFRADAFIEFIK